MTHHTHPPFMSNTPRITTISSGRDGIHDDNHCWKKRASSNWSPIHSPKKLKLLALVQAIGLWLKKGWNQATQFGNVCMCPCIFGDWYFWATLMLLLAFLEAMAAMLAGDFWHPAFREPNRTRCDGFFYLQLFVSSTVNETRSNSIPQLAHSEKLNLVFEQLMMSKWCGSALLLRQACGGDPAGISNMILDCMITGPVFWGPVAGFRAAESGWLFF